MNAPLNSVEIAAKRTANAKHFRLEDGTFQAQIFGGDIHYPDVNGNWQDISTSLFDDADFGSVNAPVYAEKHMEFTLRQLEVQNFKARGILDRTRGDFHGLCVPHDSKIAKDFSKGYEIGKCSDRLKFIPDGANSVIGSIDADNRSIVRFVNAWHNTNVTLEMLQNGIKETIILKDATAPNVFSFEVTGKLADDLTCGALKLEDAWLQDANGTKKDVTQTTRTDASGNTFLDLVADTTGLAFPVVIDPTVTIQPSASSSNYEMYMSSANPTTAGTANGTVDSAGTSSTTILRDYLQLDVTSIPSGSSVLSATLNYYVTTTSGTPFTINAHQVTGSWGTSMTWNTQPSFNSTATASVAFNSVETNIWNSWNIANIVQAWVNGTATNYGTVIKAATETGSTYINVAAIGNATASNRPYYSINYDVPPTAPGAITAPAAGATVNSTAAITWGAASDSSTETVGTLTETTSFNMYVSNTSNPKSIAQPFTVPSDASYLTTLQMYVEGASGYTGIGGTISIYATDGNMNPSGSAIATQNVSFNGTSAFITVSATFNTQLTASTQYAAVFTMTSISQSGQDLAFGATNTVPQGIASNQICRTQVSGSSSWTTQTGLYASMQLSFTEPASLLTYQIDLSTNNGSTWTNIVSATSAGATSYTYDFTNTASTSTALLRVRAYDGIAYGAYTNGPVFTIQHNQPPNAPTWPNISSNGGSYNQKPKLFAGVGDPDSGNTIQNVEIQIASNNTFSTIVQDVQYGNDSGYGTQTAGWSGMPTATNTSTTINWTPQTALAAGTYYARVRCKDNNNAWGAWSATQQFSIIAVPWADTPSGAGLKAQWMNDLATAINNVRQFRGLATFSFTDGTVTTATDMKAIHQTERRTKIADVYTTIGATSPTWTNPTLDNTHDRSGQDIIDLRNAVVAA